MSHTRTSRSTSGLSEQRPFDSRSGSIGITRRGKYTEVDRIARLGVDRVAVADVVRHVGDRDDQTVAAATSALDRFAVHRVVEVARVFAVDRHEWHVAQVDPLAQVGRAAPRPGSSAAASRTAAGELVRHVELAHRDLDLHAGIVDLSEHLEHASDRRARAPMADR